MPVNFHSIIPAPAAVFRRPGLINGHVSTDLPTNEMDYYYILRRLACIMLTKTNKACP